MNTPIHLSLIENIAKVIASWICYRDVFHNVTVKHTDILAGKYQIFGDVSWASSVATQTIAKKTRYIGFTDSGFVHELGSRESFKEMAIKAMRGTVSGGNVWVTRNMTPTENGGASPLEKLFHVEVSDAVVESKMTRNEANTIVIDWVKELDRKRPPQKKGVTVHDIFDLEKGEPVKEHRETYESVKAELRNRGLPL